MTGIFEVLNLCGRISAMAQSRLLFWIGLILLILNLVRPIQSQTQADSIIANEGKGNGSTQKSKIRIGIMGGGITGAGSAHWLHHYLDEQFGKSA